jgi:tetratricopeptide (TPR) repeat protein/tRNA A-37 threonylcarbamoyl transferase component Bud32
MLALRLVQLMDRVGQQCGNYRLRRLLGRGGFAEVYLGEHLYLQTQAAVKVLHTRLASGDLKDFLQEARTIAHLEHPHIIQVLDFGLQDSTPYLVMHYACNGSLRQRHPAGSPVPIDCVVGYVKDVAAALQYAHNQRLIHCDIKPENMLLGRNDVLYLSDFGVAVMTRSSSSRETGGTIAYMAPEQIDSSACPASDQYALAIVVYEWLTGSRPFTGAPEEIIEQHLTAQIPLLREKLPQSSALIEQVLARAMAKRAEQRFASVQDFALALEEAHEKAGGASAPPPHPQAPPPLRVQKTRGDEKACGASAPPPHPQAPPPQRVQETRGDGEACGASAPPPHPQAPVRVQKMRGDGEAGGASAPPPHPQAPPPLLNIPYHRNLFFTGREDTLQRLAAAFFTEHDGPWPRAQVICGLGGMGKTQLAIEYAYRYRAHYRAILWAKADTAETLLAEYAGIAELLNLQQGEHDQQRSAEAVKHWLEAHSDWLLILDNVDDLAVANEFMPREGAGHILLTARSQVIGTLARHIALEKMGPDEGALFLLRRAKILAQEAELAAASDADIIEAQDIARIMDGLPLALDQAGAYIEETACGLFEYLERFRGQHGALLDLRGEAGSVSTHPEPVAATWLLSFEKVAYESPLAADMLKLCAFLDPDGIPEEIFAGAIADPDGTLHSSPAALDGAIATLRRFSLVRRNQEINMLTMHRLVQTVLRDRMSEQEQRRWAEGAVRGVNSIFPEGDQVASWPQCHRSMPSVRACLPLVELWSMTFPEAARLLDQAGLYLLEQAQYTQARILFQKALAMREELVGSEHLDVAESLSNLAGPYLYQGMYAQAEPLFERSLAIRLKLQGQSHPDVAVALNNLALLYKQQGKYSQAEPLFHQALAIWAEIQGLAHPDVAGTLNNLALLYQEQEKFAQAEEFYRQALAIWERIRGPVHPDVATGLNNLAMLLHRLGKYSQAESLFQRALEIREKTLGPEHPATAHGLHYLARVHQSQWKYAEAERFFKHALRIRKQSLGAEHPDVARCMHDLARLYAAIGRYDLAEQFYRQALEICERALGPDHPLMAEFLEHYAVLLSTTGRKSDALTCLRRAKANRQHQSA